MTDIYTFGCWQAPWTPLYPISYFLSCQKILFLAEVIAISEIAHFCDKLASPLTSKVWCKQPYIYIWVLASTLAHSASEINKALSVTYKLLFILSKNIVPSRSYRYIRDRAFPVTRLPPPIYTKFDVKQRYIHTYIYGPLCFGNK